jgi:hypothetical protein
MMTRTYVQLPDEVHTYLSGYAHEQSTRTSKRVSLSAVVVEICTIAVEEMKRKDAERGRRG